VVIQYGVPRDVPTTLQRGGRGGRTKSARAIYLIMYEPWVTKIDLSTIAVSSSDPDHPIVEKLSKTSSKQERTGIAMVKIIQSTECPRKMFADYPGDKTPDGTILFLIISNLVPNFDSLTIHNAVLLQSTLRSCLSK
jgi:superfamily II DNA helicase RecQ